MLDYQKLRNQCLKPSFVAEKLGLKSDEFEKGSIAEDLEHRAKERTLAKLKDQGLQYKSFNDNILYVMDASNQKQLLLSELEQRPESRQSMTSELQDKLEKISHGFKFQKRLHDVKTRKYFDQKYSLDYQISEASQLIQN